LDASGTGPVNFNNSGAMGFNGGTTAKTLTLSGANAGDNTLAAVIGDNTGATSVTKSGAGKWILSGTNTYSGNTIVNGGELTLADNGQLKFVIGGNGTNNQVNGNSTGTNNLDGDFNLDLTGADTNTVGNSWTLVTNTVTAVYGATFSVKSSLGNFTEAADVHTLAIGGGQSLSFSEATGVLTVVGAGGPSTNAELNSLVLTPAGTLSPAFSSGVTSYTATNNYGATPTVTVVNADVTATNRLIFNGTTNQIASGVASSALTLAVGVNPVVVQVTAQDGVTVKSYTVNVTLLPSQSSPTLSRSVSGGTLNLSWPASHLGYSLQVKTNARSAGLNGGTWTPVAGSASVTSTNIPISTTTPTTFYRLVYP